MNLINVVLKKLIGSLLIAFSVKEAFLFIRSGLGLEFWPFIIMLTAGIFLLSFPEIKKK